MGFWGHNLKIARVARRTKRFDLGSARAPNLGSAVVASGSGGPVSLLVARDGVCASFIPNGVLFGGRLRVSPVALAGFVFPD